MCVMNSPMLPIPNPTDWMTTEAAAALLGVSRRTVERLSAGYRPRLTPYKPYGIRGERIPTMYWRAEVNALVDARSIALPAKEGK